MLLPNSVHRTLILLLLITVVTGTGALAQSAAPFRFTENRGQIVDATGSPRPDILFTARSQGGMLYLRTGGLSYVFVRVEHDSLSMPSLSTTPHPLSVPDTTSRTTTYRMDVEFVGANADTRVERLEAGDDEENFYLAHCPQGITGVRGYGRVVYHDIYPKIDLVYYATAQGMKYDFIVHPGGHASDIRLRYIGSSGAASTADGRMRIDCPLGSVEEGRPTAYTGHDGAQQRHPVHVDYRLADSTITFDVGPYDHSRDLVIDPLLRWSTYFGGSGFEYSWGLFLWGTSRWGWAGRLCRGYHDPGYCFASASKSLDFPTTPGVMQTTKMSTVDYDVVIVRLNGDGARVWATYCGGTQDDAPTGVAVGILSSNCYVVGNSQSPDLPVTPGAFTPVYSGPSSGYILELDAAGHKVWCTYYGSVVIQCDAIDKDDNLVVGGWAGPGLVTTPGAFQTTPPGADRTKGFLARFSPTGARRWATYFGGTPLNPNENGDGVGAVAMDPRGKIYATGTTNYADFPIVGTAFQPAYAGASDAWVATLDTNGIPIWSTFLGGTHLEFGNDIELDPSNNVYVAGATESPDFPVSANAFQPALQVGNGLVDCFLVKLDSNGRRQWSTYYGGTTNELGPCLAVDNAENVWLGTTTGSTDFPVTPDAYQATSGGTNANVGLVEFDSVGRRLWATYYGGSLGEYLLGVAPSLSGVVLAGSTQSTDLPMAGTPFQGAINGPWDMFMAAFCGRPVTVPTSDWPQRLCHGDSVILSAPPGYAPYLWSTGATTQSIVVDTAGVYTVTVGYGACGSTSDPFTVTLYPVPQRRVIPHGPLVLCDRDSLVLQLDGPARTYRWSTGDTTSTIVVTTGGRFSAFFVDANGCSGRTDTVTVRLSVPSTAHITAAGPVSFCSGGSVVLDAGAGFSRYQWSTGDTTQQITVTKSGIYWVRVANADGCWSPLSNMIAVTVFPKPTVGWRNLLPTVFCEGDSTIIVAVPATFVRYQWSNGATTPIVVLKKEGVYTLTVTDSNGCTASTQVTTSVTASPHPTLTVSGPRRFCRGDSVVITVSGFLQYLWSNGATAQSIVVKEPGRYFVTVMNEGGCFGTSDTVTVEVTPQPSVAISGPVRVCPNTLAGYSAPASSHTTYTWTVPSGGTITAGAGTGTIAVQWAASGSGILRLHAVNDSTGCSADTTITVEIGSSLQPVVTANRSLKLCTGDSVMLDAGAYATYRWSTGATTRTIVVGTPGSYAVSVTDAKGCGGMSDPVEVTLNAPPVPVIIVPNGGIFCAGDSIVLDAGAGYAKYLWSNGFTSRHATLRTGMRVSVTVTDTNGCSGTSAEATVTAVPQPVPAINGPRQVCRNSTVTYATPTTSGSTYQWAVTGGTLLSGQGTPGIRVGWGATGNGRIDLVELSVYGCSGASPGLDVTIGDHLVPTITPAGPVALCPDATVHLDAGAGYASYLWSNGATSPAIDVTSAGIFTVTVADSSGCSGTSDPVTIVTKAAPTPAITGGPLEFCDGGSVTLTADAGSTAYLWSTGATTPAITVARGGNYTVTVTDVDGCTGTSTPVTVTVHPLPPKPVITQSGDQLTSTPGTTYQWLLGGSTIPGATAQTYRTTATGQYRVIITNEFGCAAVSDPVDYRTSAGARLVTLDTVSVRVGERAELVMHVMPALSAADAVHGYHAELRFDPRALFIHDVISPDRTVAGDPATYTVDAGGLLVVDRAPASPALTGGELFRVAFEGLVTGRPLDVMTIEKMTMPEVTAAGIAGNGLVILSGCELGTAFGKLARIDAILPNPAHEEMVVRYRLPVGVIGELRLADAAGRAAAQMRTPAGTGEYEEMHVDLAHVSSGVYMVELRNGAERSGLPVVIVK